MVTVWCIAARLVSADSLFSLTGTIAAHRQRQWCTHTKAGFDLPMPAAPCHHPCCTALGSHKLHVALWVARGIRNHHVRCMHGPPARMHGRLHGVIAIHAGGSCCCCICTQGPGITIYHAASMILHSHPTHAHTMQYPTHEHVSTHVSGSQGLGSHPLPQPPSEMGKDKG